MIRQYCDICGREITSSPVEERYKLQITNQDNWDTASKFWVNDICRTCYLDIVDEVKRKQNLKDYCDIDIKCKEE
jgi:hypothetical protein